MTPDTTRLALADRAKSILSVGFAADMDIAAAWNFIMAAEIFLRDVASTPLTLKSGPCLNCGRLLGEHSFNTADTCNFYIGGNDADVRRTMPVGEGDAGRARQDSVVSGNDASQKDLRGTTAAENIDSTPGSNPMAAFAAELARQERVRSYRDGDCYLVDCRLTIGDLRRLLLAPGAQGPSRETISFGYTNWRNKNSERRAIPISFRYGVSEYHKRAGWLMLALDVDKNEQREFSMRDMVLVEPADAILALAPQPHAEPVALPEIPDDDADFTPDLARKIITKYQQLLCAQPPSACREALEYWRNMDSAWKHRKILGIDAEENQFVMRWRPQTQPHHDKEGWFEQHFRRSPVAWMPLPAALALTPPSPVEKESGR